MSANKNQRQTRRLRRLYAEDPHCRFCGVLTWLPHSPGCDAEATRARRRTMATLEHLDSRWSGRRGSFANMNVPRTTLACHGCNQARALEDMKASKGA